MTYDREENAIVQQDECVWIAGISDEGGTGAYVAAAMKQYIQPAIDEVKILDDFIQQTVRGTLQQNGTYSVINSAFFYQPNITAYAYEPSFNWMTWASWNRTRAYGINRAYNYIWPTTAYWTMYRTARDYPELEFQADWSWYLMQAYNTVQFCFSDTDRCDYATVGLMGETVLHELLEDLRRENMTVEHDALESNLRMRAELWAQ